VQNPVCHWPPDSAGRAGRLSTTLTARKKMNLSKSIAARDSPLAIKDLERPVPEGSDLTQNGKSTHWQDASGTLENQSTVSPGPEVRLPETLRLKDKWDNYASLHLTLWSSWVPIFTRPQFQFPGNNVIQCIDPFQLRFKFSSCKAIPRIVSQLGQPPLHFWQRQCALTCT